MKATYLVAIAALAVGFGAMVELARPVETSAAQPAASSTQGAQTAPAEKPEGTVLRLATADRDALEKFLGKDVVARAVPAFPIDEAAAYYGLREGTWHGKLTGGSTKESGRYRITKAKNDSIAKWRGVSDAAVQHIQYTDDGNVQMIAEEDLEQKVLSKFDPPQPFVLKGMKPGESKKIEMRVEVYDIDKPDKLRHKGKLTLTFTYVGAYEVHAPIKTFDAILLKWHFGGQVGPAKVDDTIYRFLAKDVGLVAFVELVSTSAMFVYQDDSRFGFVLKKVE